MKYQLIACDVDGTLYTPQGVIQPFTRDVILKVQELGVAFVIVTGRNDCLVTDILRELNNDGLVIGCNGATVRNILTGQAYVSYTIEPAIAEEIIDYFLQNQVLFSGYSLDKCFCLSRQLDAITALQQKYFRIKRTQRFPFSVLEDPRDMLSFPLIKICTFTETLDQSVALQEQLNNHFEIQAFRPSNFVLDLVKKGVSKGAALKEYAEGMGIARDAIVAIGDGNNDIPMLEYAGLAVAMKNGTPEIFPYADMITDSNEDDGVGKALNKIFSNI